MNELRQPRIDRRFGWAGLGVDGGDRLFRSHLRDLLDGGRGFDLGHVDDLVGADLNRSIAFGDLLDVAIVDLFRSGD